MTVDVGGTGSRRVFADRLERRISASGSSASDLLIQLLAQPLTTSVTADDQLAVIDAPGTAPVLSRVTAANLRAYVLGISGGTATIPENLTVQGNTTLGNATSDTITPVARLADDLDPSADQALDLGDVALNFARMFSDLFAHLATIDGTVTLPSTHNAVLGGPVVISGTVTVAGTLVVV